MELIINKRASTQWVKSNISYSNYQNYIKQKTNKFQLTLIDLLYISNFKGGNATINEPEDVICSKLESYSRILSIIDIGFQGYKILVNNILHGRVYRRMIEHGNLKKVEFIKRRIPSSIEEYYRNDGNPEQIPGTLKTSMLSSTSLPQNFKRFVDNLFTNPNRERIEIEGIDEEFDEVEFELELNGKKKTFYVMHKNRIQPDLDVTGHIDFDEEGIPTLESLIEQSEELVRDIIELRL